MVDNQSPQAAADAVPATTVGRILQTARTAKNLSLEQLANDLRIEARHLRALEDDDFERIGAAVFAKGYIKQYAQRLGLDPSEVLARYGREVTTREVDLRPSRTIRLRADRPIMSFILAGLLLVALVGLLAFWWFVDPRFAL